MNRLEVNDQATPNPASDLTAGGKLQADYLSTVQGDAKFVKVADTQVAQAAPSDQAQSQDDGDQKVGVKQIVGADPKELSSNLKTLQGLAQHFDAADDKGKAMTEVKPEVEKTVKAADDALTKAQADAEAASKILKPQFEAAQTAMKASVAKVQDVLKTIPQEDAKHVQMEVGLLMDPKSSPALKKAIEADLGSHKGLVPAIKDFVKAEKNAEPVMEKVQALNQGMREAASEPIITRMIYADMLEQAGDKKGAQQVNAESMALQMGMTVEQFRQLQKLKEEQEKKNAPADAPAKGN